MMLWKTFLPIGVLLDRPNDQQALTVRQLGNRYQSASYPGEQISQLLRLCLNISHSSSE